MSNLIKINRDDAYDYKWSVDGNKYGESYDITSASGFGDTDLVNKGWEEVLAVNGGLFYTWENAHYACGLEKSRGVNNQDVSMTAVSDYNGAMAVACVESELWFGKQEWIINNKLDAAYGALTGIGLLLDGKAITYGQSEFASQYKAISGRTIIGEDKDGNFLSYSIKGETGSSGITGAEAVKIAQENGFHNAIMLDGGGSVWRRYFKAYDITTTRKVKNALILYRKKKDSVSDDTNEDSSVPMFSERLSSAGIKNNKYWYDADYNKGAKSAGTMLPNCFSGETEFITKNGIKRFDEVAGQDVEVLGRDGTFYKAHVNKYEAQPLYKVTMCNGYEYYATENHRWIIVSSTDNDVIKTTGELMTLKHPRFRLVKQKSSIGKEKLFVQVKSVELTSRVEDVYCVNEPIHHEFTLAGGVLTKNCTCYCVGRSEEIAGQAVKIFPNISVGGFYDAKEWYDKSDWVGSNQPVEGGILCWGASTDKYGHVAICERVLGNTGNGWKVLVSQSNYGGTFFETKEYVVNRGSKTAGVGFIYNGCLHNPYIRDIRVDRDITKNQVEVLVDLLKLRKDANGDVVEGLFVAPGIYNIIETKEAGDYTWAKLDSERWIALNDAEGWTKTYFVDDSGAKTDPELEDEISKLKAEISGLTNKISELNKEISELKSQNESLTTQVNEAKQDEVVAENKAKSYKEIIEAAKVILDREV